MLGALLFYDNVSLKLIIRGITISRIIEADTWNQLTNM